MKEKRKQTRQHANELDGKTWLRHSVSVWSDIRKTKEETDLKHPAMFPIALAQRLIACFTPPEGSLILDPFAGVGSTLLAAKELGKDAIGIEISPEFAQVAERRVAHSIKRQTFQCLLANLQKVRMSAYTKNPPTLGLAGRYTRNIRGNYGR